MFLTENPFSDHGPNKQGLSESFKYHIPEDIPANERTAFHGAAAAAAKAGKKKFNFGGKTHPVTMKKDLANKIADQKESKMTFREKLISEQKGQINNKFRKRKKSLSLNCVSDNIIEKLTGQFASYIKENPDKAYETTSMMKNIFELDIKSDE